MKNRCKCREGCPNEADDNSDLCLECLIQGCTPFSHLVETGCKCREDDPEVARIVHNMDLLSGGPETDPFA